MHVMPDGPDRRTARRKVRPRGHGGPGEAALVARLRRALGGAARGHGVAVGIGDDAAVLVPPAAGSLVATVDMVVEGQHFRLAGAGAVAPADAGWRALAVNLSDIAAMGARPRWALCSLGVPRRMSAADLEALYAGVAELAAVHGVAVVGGNLARVDERLVVDVALLGWAERVILRRGARPGDRLMATGRLGLAAAALALAEAGTGTAALPADQARELEAARRRPEPRVEEGLRLAALPPGAVHAACDVSDGLAMDACRLCGPGLQVVVWEDALPVAEATRAAGRVLGVDPLTWALFGGEDYELLVAVAPEAEGAVEAALRGTAAGVRTIGEFATGPRGVALAPRRDGRARPLARRGWDPFRG